MATNTKISKIGFSKIGGIFIGKDIVSDFHKNYALTVIMSFGKSFKLYTSQGYQGYFKYALIQRNIDLGIESSKDEHVAFVHIVPYSEEGIRLTDSTELIKELDSLKSQHSLALIKDWYASDGNSPEMVEKILHSISLIPDTNRDKKEIDSRILNALKLIMKIDDKKLYVENIADSVSLSVSQFNRLLKKETGLTFRKFVLHSKLIKSISAINDNSNLTEASFIGGFSDQPHLTRTFKENFGIKPSKILK